MLFGARARCRSLLALWFAPALVVFQDAGAVTALGTSLRAALANWRPIGVFGLAVFVLGGVLPFRAMRSRTCSATPVAGLHCALRRVPYLFAFVATLQIADYVSYRDVFHADEPPRDAIRVDTVTERSRTTFTPAAAWRIPAPAT